MNNHCIIIMCRICLHPALYIIILLAMFHLCGSISAWTLFYKSCIFDEFCIFVNNSQPRYYHPDRKSIYCPKSINIMSQHSETPRLIVSDPLSVENGLIQAACKFLIFGP